MTFLFFFFVSTIQRHNPYLALQLASDWVTRQPWLEAAVVRGPRSSARASSRKGQGHHSQSLVMTLMGYDREEVTQFAMPHNICSPPLPQHVRSSYWAETQTQRTHTLTQTHTHMTNTLPSCYFKQPLQSCQSSLLASRLVLFCTIRTGSKRRFKRQRHKWIQTLSWMWSNVMCHAAKYY